MNNTMRLNYHGKFEAIDPTDVGTVWWANTINNALDNMSPQMALEHKNVTLAQYPLEFEQSNNEGYHYFTSLLALGVPLRDATGKARAFASARSEQLVVLARVTRERLDVHALFSEMVKVAQSQRIDRVDSISG